MKVKLLALNVSGTQKRGGMSHVQSVVGFLCWIDIGVSKGWMNGYC